MVGYAAGDNWNSGGIGLSTVIAYRKTFGELIGQLNPKNKEDRELAHSLGLATEENQGTARG